MSNVVQFNAQTSAYQLYRHAVRLATISAHIREVKQVARDIQHDLDTRSEISPEERNSIIASIDTLNKSIRDVERDQQTLSLRVVSEYQRYTTTPTSSGHVQDTRGTTTRGSSESNGTSVLPVRTHRE